jgi:O-antigen ligase
MHFGLEAYAHYGIYTGAILAFLLSVFWKPQIGVYYLVPFLPLQTVRYWLHPLPLGEKFVDILLLGVLIGLFLHARKPIFPSSPLNKALVVFIGLTYLSLWQGAFYLGGALPISVLDPRFSDWKNYVEMMLLFVIVAGAIRTPRQIKILVFLMCLSVLLVNRAFHNDVGSRDFSSNYSDDLRVGGPLGYAGENGMAAFQAEFAIFLIGMATYTRSLLRKVGLLTLACTSVYCLVFTFSRGGYVGLLAGLLILGVIRDRKLLFVLLIILVGWQSLVPNAVRERVLMTYHEGEGLESSAQERVDIWQDALDVIKHNPITGTGFDTYRFMRRVGPYTDTHNYYLKVVLEMGFVGLLCFLWLLNVAGKMSWRLFRSAEDPFLSALGSAFFSMILCAMAVNLFGDRWSLLQVNGFLWVLLGCVARGLALVTQEEQSSRIDQGKVSVVSAG